MAVQTTTDRAKALARLVKEDTPIEPQLTANVLPFSARGLALQAGETLGSITPTIGRKLLTKKGL